MTADSIGLIVGAVLTVLVLTYIIGDSFLFRLAVHILIGAGAAYAAVVVLFDVLWKPSSDALAQAAVGNPGPLVIVVAGLVLGIMVWFKASPRLAWIGNMPVGYLIGVGAATVLGGAIIGTLGPQIVAAGAPATSPSGGQPDVMMTFIVVLGTIVTLLSFGYYRTDARSDASGQCGGAAFLLDGGAGRDLCAGVHGQRDAAVRSALCDLSAVRELIFTRSASRSRSGRRLNYRYGRTQRKSPPS